MKYICIHVFFKYHKLLTIGKVYQIDSISFSTNSEIIVDDGSKYILGSEILKRDFIPLEEW
jgi:hypothetical protein